MSTAEQVSPPLVSGEKLSREEFLRRWEALPHVKFAELLEGEVYMPSPLLLAHGSKDNTAGFWLGYYAGFTPGCRAVNQVTWLMLRDAPQPDCCLFIKPEYGGQSSEERGYGSGAPELIVEVAVSSAARDLGPKLRLYRQAGVQEYVNVLVKESRVIWHRLAGGKWAEIQADTDGLLRSVVFPGLWLDPAALLREDIPRLTEVLRQGLDSPEHRRFIEKLAKKV